MDIISINELSVTEINLKRISAEHKDQLENALKMACTEETKKAVKAYRAELNKLYGELESERKAVTAEYEDFADVVLPSQSLLKKPTRR